MRNVWVKTDVTAEPITLAEAKSYCKVTGTGDDVLFTYLIRAAREELEAYTGRSFATKTIYAEWDKLPKDGKVRLPKAPVSSITSIKTIDEESTETTLTINTEYYVNGSPWPTVRISAFWGTRITRVRAEYIVGYGATGCPPLPIALKMAMLKDILTQYDIREDINIGNISSVLSNNSKAIAAPYRDELWFAREA